MIPGLYGMSKSGFVGLSSAFLVVLSLLIWWTWQRHVVRPTLKRKRKRPSFFFILLLLWVLGLLYGEIGTQILHTCQFASSDSKTHRLLLLADPQITDRWAYPGLPTWAHYWVAFVCDLQLRRSFQSSVWMAQPDAAVILGDLFWGAPQFESTDEWSAGIRRLNQVFGPPHKSLTLAQLKWKEALPTPGAFQPRIPTAVIAGNHDVWMYRCEASLNLPKLFREAFGALNFRAGVDESLLLVGVVSPLLQDRRCGGEHAVAQRETQKWVEEFKRESDDANSVLLLSHIPLASKSRWTGECNLEHIKNARRRDFHLRPGSGRGYENTLAQDLTSSLLNHIRPSLVLSGDAHDLCQVVLDDEKTWDITLPSCSWLEGTLHHGYMLLESNGGKVVWKICWQPQQLFIYIFYGVAFAFSLVHLAAASEKSLKKFAKSVVLLVLVILTTFGLAAVLF